MKQQFCDSCSIHEVPFQLLPNNPPQNCMFPCRTSKGWRRSIQIRKRKRNESTHPFYLVKKPSLAPRIGVLYSTVLKPRQAKVFANWNWQNGLQGKEIYGRRMNAVAFAGTCLVIEKEPF